MEIDPGSFISVPQHYLLNSDVVDLFRVGPDVLRTTLIVVGGLCLIHMALHAVLAAIRRGAER